MPFTTPSVQIGCFLPSSELSHKSRHCVCEKLAKYPIGGEGPWVPIRTRRQYLEELDGRTDIYLVHPPQEIIVHWEKTVQVLTEFRDLPAGQGIRMLLVLLPDHVQVDQELRQEFLTARGENPSLFDFERPQRMLKEWREQRRSDG